MLFYNGDIENLRQNLLYFTGVSDIGYGIFEKKTYAERILTLLNIRLPF